MSSLAEGILNSDGVLPGKLFGQPCGLPWFRVRGEHPSETARLCDAVSAARAELGVQ